MGGNLGQKLQIARNCLVSTLNCIVMQMSKVICEKGYSIPVWLLLTCTSSTECAQPVFIPPPALHCPPWDTQSKAAGLGKRRTGNRNTTRWSCCNICTPGKRSSQTRTPPHPGKDGWRSIHPQIPCANSDQLRVPWKRAGFRAQPNWKCTGSERHLKSKWMKSEERRNGRRADLD